MSEPPAQPRRRRGPVLWWAAVAVGLLLVGGVLWWQAATSRAAAEERYASAVRDWNGAVAARDETLAAYEDLRADAEGMLAVARLAADPGAEGDLDADAVAAAGERTAPVSDAILGEDVSAPAQAHEVSVEELDSTEEYVSESEMLEADAAELREQLAPFEDAAAALRDALPPLEEALAAVAAGATDAAARIEGENVSATAVSRLQLEQAAAALTGVAPSEARDAMSAYLAAADEVRASQAAELAEKQRDGLYEQRLAVEKFTRELVGDMRVDFDWAPIVNGLGYGNSAGGITHWTFTDGGYATLELSDSIAAYWPESGMQALVAHEAGHAITTQCVDLFQDVFGGDAERMATAWAIGMGYTDPRGNGVDFYFGGVPPAQHEIDATKSCR